jgi:hypothetical protein
METYAEIIRRIMNALLSGQQVGREGAESLRKIADYLDGPPPVTDTAYDRVVHEREEACADLAASRARIAQLESALSALVAVQNGPPLIRDAATWQAAYDAAVAALDKEVE